MKKTVSFMDIGTNSCKVSTVEIDLSTKSYRNLESFRVLTRLGESSHGEKYLHQDAIERTVSAVKKLLLLSKGDVCAVATSAVREAENKDDFLRRVYEETGLLVNVISGQEEANIIYEGISASLDFENEYSMFLDIGGGSTEVMAGNKDTCVFSESFKIGAIKIYEQFFSKNADKINHDEYKSAVDSAKTTMKRACNTIKSLNPKTLVGSSGTITNLGEITRARTLKYFDLKKKYYTISTKDLMETIDILLSLDLEERRKLPGIKPERADIIVPGAAIIDAVIQNTGFENITITNLSLRDGLVIDYIKMY